MADVVAPIELVDVSQVGCQIEGSQAMCDGFYWGSADATFAELGAAQDGVQLDLSAQFDATFFLDVADEATTGSWKFSGDWRMVFGGSVNGEASVAMTGDGEATGDAGEFSVAGTETNAGTATVGGRSFPISNTAELAEVTVEVTGGNCVEVTGEWRMSWAALAAEVGWTGTDTISGGFTAIRNEEFDREISGALVDGVIDGTTTDEDVQNAALPELAKDFTAVLVAERRLLLSLGVEPVGDADVARVLSIVSEFERIAAEIKNLNECEREMSADLITQFSGWAARTVEYWSRLFGQDDGSRFSGEALHSFSEAAVRTGAIGAGSSLSTEAQNRIRSRLSGELEAVLERTMERDDGALWPRTRAEVPESVAAIRAAVALRAELTIHGEEATFDAVSVNQLARFAPQAPDLESTDE